MKLLLIIAMALVATIQAQAQEPANFAAAGISYGASVAGTGMYARQVIGSTGTFAFTVMDAIPQSYKPFTVATSYSAGVAQRLFTIKDIQLFVPTSAGISYSGSNTGWAWTTGGLAVVPIRGSWKLLPNVRVVRSNVSNSSNYQLIGGIMIGWGW